LNSFDGCLDGNDVLKKLVIFFELAKLFSISVSL